MNLPRVEFVVQIIVCFSALAGWAGDVRAAVVAGSVNVVSPEGQPLALKMTIDDAKTRFELTGPSFSWFAWGFDTETMQGYSIILEGLDDTRSAVEQNLVGRGNPGSPQAVQDLDFIDATYDSDADLTTVILERLNDTGDENDPVLAPSMTSLALIFAYDSSATVTQPNPNLANHGRSGRGFATITFEPVPEAGTMTLLMLGASIAAAICRRRRVQLPSAIG